MNLGPKKDGSPNLEFFQSYETLQGFETVRLWLQKNHKKVSGRREKMEADFQFALFPFFQYFTTDPPTKESLSQLIVQLLQFQETRMGKNTQEQTNTTRLPVTSSGHLERVRKLTISCISDAILHGLQAGWRSVLDLVDDVPIQERTKVEEVRLHRQQQGELDESSDSPPLTFQLPLSRQSRSTTPTSR